LTVLQGVFSHLSPKYRDHLRGWYRSGKVAWVRRFRAYLPADLERSLRRMSIQAGDTLLVHSAFGTMLGFQGSPSALLNVFRKVLGPTGNLMMVSLPYLTSTSDYLRTGPVFDVRSTPSKMGLVSETLRRQPAVYRSLHPTHSVLASGPRAEWIVAGHERCVHACGAGSPYERLLALDGKVLFFGVSEFHFTFHHYLEDMIRDELPFPLYEPEPSAVDVIDASGNRSTVATYAFNQEAIRRRRVQVLFDEMERRGQLKRSRIGNTSLVLLRAADSVACTNDLTRNGIFFYDMSGLMPIRNATLEHEGKSSAMFKGVKRRVRETLHRYALPPAAKRVLQQDANGLPADDPGIERAVAAALKWLCRAQDMSRSNDGGVARAYSLLNGWNSSYPETTGYIIPTFMECAERNRDDALRARARRMLDWLVAIQLPGGGFQGGRIDSKPIVPVVFNTGQILLGLASGESKFGGYREPLRRAADWLVEAQDADGCWRRHSSPFAGEGEKTYDLHAAWGLLEADRVDPGRGYSKAALANVAWALAYQRNNGWFANCCLSNFSSPLTHTLGYALRGLVEAYRFTSDPQLLAAACRTADGLLGAQHDDGSIPGQLRSDWSADVEWSGLTGISQIAICWLLLHRVTQDVRYWNAAVAANRYVRRTMILDGSPDVCGGVKGSFPIDGGYCRYEYPNWAPKFLIDSLLIERDGR
jgi:aminoglycoside N3'-acetyltransferase